MKADLGDLAVRAGMFAGRVTTALRPHIGSLLLLALKLMIIIAFMAGGTRPFIYQNF